MARLFAVDERTVDRMVADRLLPRPVKYGRQPRWRWGLIRRWMEATEFLQGLGVELPPEDDEPARKGQTNSVDSETTSDTGQNPPSAARRPR